MKKNILFIIMVFAIAGCGNTEIKEIQSTPYKSTDYFNLKTKLDYDDYEGNYLPWVRILKKGIYRSSFEDASGYYYTGPTSAVTLRQSGRENHHFEGGVWRSKNDEYDIRIFYLSTYDKIQSIRDGLLGQLLTINGKEKPYLFQKNESAFTFLQQAYHKN